MSLHGASAAVATALLAANALAADAQPAQLNSLKDVSEKLSSCWEPPPRANPKTSVSVIVTFGRDGSILGQPRITYESEDADDNDRLAYRIAIMKALERCTPLPFSDALGAAVAGRPFAWRVRGGKYKPQNKERSAWLMQKTP
jgi:hypothetical protein